MEKMYGGKSGGSMKDVMQRGDECPMHDPVGSRYPEGSTPALTKDYGAKNDSDLTNGFVPQVRTN